MLKNTGPNNEPCVTPMLTLCVCEKVSLTLTFFDLLPRPTDDNCSSVIFINREGKTVHNWVTVTGDFRYGINIVREFKVADKGKI
ncbi:hypothetical protein TNCV_2962761 [Trichonephila clavipes]|nr:hypothetical protein TNCV_2962761 [Trichonephila clavipes]